MDDFDAREEENTEEDTEVEDELSEEDAENDAGDDEPIEGFSKETDNEEEE